MAVAARMEAENNIDFLINLKARRLLYNLTSLFVENAGQY